MVSESLRGQAMWAGLESQQGDSERLLHEAEKVKSKLQWRPKDVGGAKTRMTAEKKTAGIGWT